ncbi:GFA family protein [Pseudomonas anatoliensis]|uniref:GFA family protein n=1 Tax=Pseudomonas anatoliensis TaxID=2710589 RepID=UPI001B31B7A0|nr:GFA family protein [Pseudomonas anatoliensis]MBP5959281.1 GFA family protein [Pseudomonas anatoliensis]
MQALSLKSNRLAVSVDNASIHVGERPGFYPLKVKATSWPQDERPGSVPSADLQLLQGADDIKAYRSSESVLRQFCFHCGSSLFWSRRQGEFADWISIALGTLDTPFTSDKQKHVEVLSKASWYDIQDHWPQRQSSSIE